MDTIQVVIAGASVVNAFAVVVLVWVTWKYAKATERLVDSVGSQLEAAREQAELQTLTAEILAHAGIAANQVTSDSFGKLRRLANELGERREASKRVVPSEHA